MLTTQARASLAAALRARAADPELPPDKRAELLRNARNMEALNRARGLEDAAPEGEA